MLRRRVSPPLTGAKRPTVGAATEPANDDRAFVEIDVVPAKVAGLT
jgi:hypothetical protein